jgi:hypothetical protein
MGAGKDCITNLKMNYTIFFGFIGRPVFVKLSLKPS